MNDTEPIRYGHAVKTALPYAEAVSRVKDLLKEQGFGVLCEIDVAKTMREKLNASFPPYVILGACNPELARRALGEEPQLGLLLPCNVVVQETEGHTVVSAIDAQALLRFTGNSALTPIADEADARLLRVLGGIPALPAS